ncbi:MAG: ATP synthase F0 subunit C [Lachnospiraceae bacterium]|nr:ATP synthase F0 subunit C [Lachnospiraceae bacterium]
MVGVGVGGVITAQASDGTAKTVVREGAEAPAAAEAETAATGANDILGKAIGAGIGVGIAAMGGALGMGMAVARCGEGIARQPEAAGKIQTIMMLGLVFIETVVIYALIIGILTIFVL